MTNKVLTGKFVKDSAAEVLRMAADSLKPGAEILVVIRYDNAIRIGHTPISSTALTLGFLEMLKQDLLKEG